MTLLRERTAIGSRQDSSKVAKCLVLFCVFVNSPHYLSYSLAFDAPHMVTFQAKHWVSILCHLVALNIGPPNLL